MKACKGNANKMVFGLKKRAYFYFKRLMDLLIAMIGLVFAGVPMLIVSLLIKMEDGGPVLFIQERTGRYGKNFGCFKFRTMAVDNDVHDFSSENRYTKVGKVIRKLSLDELPQLLNILRGEMSFIGPRPWIPDYYQSMNENQRHRCDVLPGITGLAQAKGRNNITIFQKINYDLEYIENYSLLEDIKVVFLTIYTVLSKEGADASKGTIQQELEDLKTQKISIKEISEKFEKSLSEARQEA